MAVSFVDGRVEVEVYVKGSFDFIRYTILDREGNEVIREESNGTAHTLTLFSPHLWNGKKDPYLYTLKASLISGGIEKDRVSVDIGFRSYVIDSERGFILNGEEYPWKWEPTQ